MIRSVAPLQLITTGFEAKQGKWWFKRMHEDPNVDFACGEKKTEASRVAAQNDESSSM